LKDCGFQNGKERDKTPWLQRDLEEKRREEKRREEKRKD